MAVEDLLAKQKELMDRVPHTLRDDSFAKMIISSELIRCLMLYLASTGHKPWRPNPLSADEQEKAFSNLRFTFMRLTQLKNPTPVNKDLEYFILQDVAETLKSYEQLELYKRQLVSSFGIIEEATEYQVSVYQGDCESHRLEELTDQLFFYLEQVLMSGYTWKQIEAEYYRKHAVNLKRYDDAEKGDFKWDKRDADNL